MGSLLAKSRKGGVLHGTPLFPRLVTPLIRLYYQDKSMDRRLPLIIVPAGAFLAVLPLLLWGPSCGDDFKFHLLNWLEAGAQWKQGVLWPRWDFTSTWNAGEPRFVFYPPFSWVLGAIFGLILPWAAVPAAYIWTCLCASGFTMYRLAREWTGTAGALLASCFFMVHPYMLFTSLERSAFAELLAAAWIPLLLLSILRRRLSIAGIALPIALLSLSDLPAAVLGCYSFALLAVLRVAWRGTILLQRREALRDAVRAVVGVGLGLALSGFFLVPAIWEQRWVHIIMENVPNTSYRNNFLFGQHGSVSHIAILRIASLCSVAIVSLIAAFASIALARRSAEAGDGMRQERRVAIASLLLLTAVLGFLLTSSSQPLWRWIPDLKFLQFPWRFDAMLGAVAAAMLALALSPVSRHPRTVVTAALAVSVLGGFAGNHFFRQFCNIPGGVRGMAAAFHLGEIHDLTDGYTPLTSDPLAVGHNNPPFWIALTPEGNPAKRWTGSDPEALRTRLSFSVTSPEPAWFVINLRDYPAWRIHLNGKLCSKLPHRADGLIVVPIPAGTSQITIRYALTPDFLVGCLLSLSSAILLLLAGRKKWLTSAALSC